MYLFSIYLLIGLTKLKKSSSHFMKGSNGSKVNNLVMFDYIKLLVSWQLSQAWQYYKTSLYIMGTNVWHPRFCKQWFLLRSGHHELPCAFPVALLVFLNFKNNASTPSLDLDNIIVTILKKNGKLSRLTFSLFLIIVNQKYFDK